jgi:hypothetical protein
MRIYLAFFGLFEASERNLPLILHFWQQGLKEIEG